MEFKNITCYGSGLIGTGWATNFLMQGLKVTLYDINEDFFPLAKERIESNLNFLMSEGVFTQEQLDGFMSAFSTTTDPETALKDADFIQENGPENLALKQTIVETIETYAKPDAVVASSTSGLNISDIVAKAKHPERFVGGHPYNPVFLIPLVELTLGAKTDPQVLERVLAFYKELKKEPVVLRKEAPGFIANRLQAAIIREAADLVLRGVCTVDEVDKAMLFGPGLRWGLLGPLTVSELAGGKLGIGGATRHMGLTMTKWFEDMGSWTVFPDEYVENIQGWMDTAIASRDPRHGRSNEEISAFRDKGLVTLLKYHNKF